MRIFAWPRASPPRHFWSPFQEASNGGSDGLAGESAGWSGGDGVDAGGSPRARRGTGATPADVRGGELRRRLPPHRPLSGPAADGARPGGRRRDRGGRPGRGLGEGRRPGRLRGPSGRLRDRSGRPGRSPDPAPRGRARRGCGGAAVQGDDRRDARAARAPGRGGRGAARAGRRGRGRAARLPLGVAPRREGDRRGRFEGQGRARARGRLRRGDRLVGGGLRRAGALRDGRPRRRRHLRERGR